MAPRSGSKRPARSAPDDSALQRIAARRVPAGGAGRSLAEVACDEIRKAIREGRVATGAHLTEVDLAAWLGMSRTPIREAMRRLQSEGLLLNQPFRGALVMRLDADDMRQMFAVRELLEPAAAASCAASAGPAEIAELKAAIGLLAPALREPLVLFSLEERSQQECAEILGISAKAVETKVARAREVLRRRLSRRLWLIHKSHEDGFVSIGSLEHQCNLSANISLDKSDHCSSRSAIFLGTRKNDSWST